MSNATPERAAEARAIAPIVCVQNLYNLAYRQDDGLIDVLAAEDLAELDKIGRHSGGAKS